MRRTRARAAGNGHARGHLDTMDSGLVQATYSVRPASSTVERGVRGRKGTLCGDMHDDA